MSDTESLLPVHHKNGREVSKPFKATKFCWMVPFPKFELPMVFSSYLSFFFCVFWSLAFNFEEANATHCSVENFLPSISAAIGHYYPQIYVWNSVILFNMYPRLKISTMYLHYYSSVIYEKYSNLYHLVWALNICELWSLLGLSLVTSTVNYSLHAFCFVCFSFSSMFYEILTCYLLKFKRKIPPGPIELKTLEWKFKCCFLNLFSFVMAGYFFHRHNVYCEPWVYSIFAFFEYIVVLSNMVFHQFALWDFHDKFVTVTLTSRGLELNYSPPFRSVQYTVK